jgi:hypothetical protein
MKSVFNSGTLPSKSMVFAPNKRMIWLFRHADEIVKLASPTLTFWGAKGKRFGEEGFRGNSER